MSKHLSDKLRTYCSESEAVAVIPRQQFVWVVDQVAALEADCARLRAELREAVDALRNAYSDNMMALANGYGAWTRASATQEEIDAVLAKHP